MHSQAQSHMPHAYRNGIRTETESETETDTETDTDTAGGIGTSLMQITK